MQDLARNSDKFKAWRQATFVVLHGHKGAMRGLVANCRPEIELLLEPEHFPIEGPWVPTVHGDTLHLVHPFYSVCEGEA